MNFKKSDEIFEVIKENNNFILNPHRGPDLDSVAAVAAMSIVLKKLGKDFNIYCKDQIPESYEFVKEVSDTIVCNLEDIEQSDYSHWIALDFNTWDQGGLSMEPNIPTVHIDHHPYFGLRSIVSIVDEEASSTCEILYQIFEDWGIDIDQRLATILLSGISYDTNYFQQKNTTAKTHLVASKLMDLKADNNYVTYNVKRTNELGTLKLWGEFNKRLKVNEKYKFSWTAVPHGIYKKHLMTVSSTAEYSNMVVRTLVGTNFGVCIAEKEPKLINMSFRSRVPGFDVAVIARELGGNGHKDAAGAQIKGLEYKEAIKKIFAAIKKHANQKFEPEILLD